MLQRSPTYLAYVPAMEKSLFHNNRFLPEVGRAQVGFTIANPLRFMLLSMVRSRLLRDSLRDGKKSGSNR